MGVLCIKNIPKSGGNYKKKMKATVIFSSE